MTYPLISIITVVYNRIHDLEKTISSIKNQDYHAIEYIVVDGGSKDGTVDVIKKYADQKIISKWISEKDNGLYDAMNKGLKLASGDFVWFINAGDELFSSNILSLIFKNYQSTDVFYGDAMIVDEDGKDIGLRRLSPPENLTWKSLQWGMVVSHQSFIVRREKAVSYKNELFPHSADIDWMIRCLKNSTNIVNTQMVLSKFQDDGQSKRTIRVSLKERFKIMVENYGFLRTVFNHFILGIKFFMFLVKNRRF